MYPMLLIIRATLKNKMRLTHSIAQHLVFLDQMIASFRVFSFTDSLLPLLYQLIIVF